MNIQKIISLILIAAVTASGTGVYAENTSIDTYTFDGESEITYIVELEGGGTIERASGEYAEMSAFLPNVHAAKAAAERRAAAIAGGEILNEYNHVMNGFSIKGDASDMARLKNINGVKNVYVSQNSFVPLDEATRNSEQSAPVSGSVNADTEYTGKGTVIAVIDNEFDISHEVFASDPAEPAWSEEEALSRIQNTNSAKDIDGVYKSEKIPFAFDYAQNDADTYDSVNNHGTHVAGIAAGSSEHFKGRAPDAQLALMKVARNGAGTISEACIIAALDDCAALKVDVVNMSLGVVNGFSTSAKYDTVLKKLNDLGIIISASAGNAGSFGYQSGSTMYNPYVENPDYGTIVSPASLSGAVAVAAADNYALYCGDTRLDYAESLSAARFTNSFSGIYDYAICGYGLKDDFSETDVTEKIAVCKRGKCAFSEMASNARDNGAVGLIIVNTDNSSINVNLGDVAFPCVTVAKDGGSVLENASEHVVEIKPPDSAAVFSSRGAAPDLRLKPEISDLGTDVYSSVRKKASEASGSSYGLKSGTSMAAPAFTGSVAAVLQSVKSEYGNLKSTEIMNIVRQKLCSAANVLYDGEIPISPRSQGAGLTDIRAAAETPAVLYNSDKNTKCEIGEISAGAASFQFTVKNLTASPVTYSLRSDIITDSYTNDKNGAAVVNGSEVLDGASLTFEDGNAVTLAGNSAETITVTLTLDEDCAEKRSEIFKNGFFAEGYIYLESSENPTLSIPFMGFCGDWGAVPIFAENGKSPTGADRIPFSVFTKNSATAKVRRLNYGSLNETVYAPDTDFDQLWFFVCNTRNIKQMSFYISDKESGKALLKGSTSSISKNLTDPNMLGSSSLPSGSFGFLIADKLGVGEYIMRFEVTADYEGAEAQALEIGFTIDAVAPEIENAFILREGTSSKLYIKGSDNSGETAVYLQLDDETVEAENVNEDGYSEFSLGGRSLSGASAEIYDPAGNSVSASFISGNGYNAVYKGSALARAERFDAWLLSDMILNRPQITSEADETVRAFVWDDSMCPLYMGTRD